MKKTYIVLLVIALALIFLFLYYKNEKVSILEDYSASGKLMGTNEYVVRNGKTILHGKFVNYNEQGNKISEGQFVNGHVKGECIYYYDNGKIESISYRKDSKTTEESTYYNENGLIRKYVMYNELGEPYFIITYDEKGVLGYHGYSMKMLRQPSQVLKVGDILNYSFIVAKIPNAKRSFIIQNLAIDNSKTKRILKDIVPTGIDVEEVLTKKGSNKIRAIVQYKFDDKLAPVISDTIFFNVNVN